MPRAGGHGGTSQIGGNHSNFKAQQKRTEGLRQSHEKAVALAAAAGEPPPPTPAELRPNYIDPANLLCAAVIALGMGAVAVFAALKLSGEI